MNRTCLLPPTLAVILFAAMPVRAETVTINGQNGYPGPNGTPGVGSSGVTGGEGAWAQATANTSSDPTNTAIARGGNGGTGGNGVSGDALIPTGGNGGKGGDGGWASAIANTDLTSQGGGDAKSVASATGGGGGGGGSAGPGINGFGPGIPGTPGNGGFASSSTIARTSTGKAEARSDAEGGGGYNPKTATASAQASNASNQPVIVYGHAKGGRGANSPRGIDGSPAFLGTMNGVSTGGGSVSVEGTVIGGEGGSRTNGGDGASVSLTDAVSGSTSGSLTLYQTASGGNGGTGTPIDTDNQGSPGDGGNGTSHLTINDTTAASLSLTSVASGGGGGAYHGSRPGGSPGTATASLNVTGVGHIPWGVVQATSGNGGIAIQQGGVGGAGVESTILPSSAVTSGIGKTVNLLAQQQGGGGGEGRIGGRGADSFMTNVVSGAAPSGTLTLRQFAIAGGGGRAEYYSGTSGGEGGEASSLLDFTGNGEASLVMEVLARASGAGYDPNGRTSRHGGDATASGQARDSNDVTLTVTAQGSTGSTGGNAQSMASGISTGAGRTIVNAISYGGLVNATNAGSPGTAVVSAYGASQTGDVNVYSNGYAGGTIYGHGYSTTLMDGGDITLENTASGSTAGKLVLSQWAQGGLGGSGNSEFVVAGEGGSATSSLILPGGNPGGGVLEATCNAIGGDAYRSYPTQGSGTGGAATAVCDLTNAADVSAQASANAGRSMFGYENNRTGAANATAKASSTQPYGMAVAQSYAYGPTGTLSAQAKTQGGTISRVEVTGQRPAAENAGMSIGCLVNRSTSTSGYYASTMSAIGLPLAQDWNSALSGKPNAAAALNGAVPLGLVSGGLNAGDSSTSAAFVINPTGLTGNLKLALVGTTIWNGTIGTLEMKVKRGGATFINQSFSSLADFATFCNDQVLDLGPASLLAGQELSVSFAFVGAVGFNTGFTAKIAFGAKERHRLTVNASGGTVSVNPVEVDYDDGATVFLTATPNSGNTFIGWSGDVTGSANPAILTMNGHKTVTAIFALGLSQALDTSQRQYASGGNNHWFGQTAITHDGIDAAQSGAIGHNQESWFETTVSGPDALSFWWKVSSESGYDYLEFYLDGILQAERISGNVDWHQRIYTLEAGQHTLRWRYMKDGSVVSGADAAWVDQIIWAPSASYASWQSAHFTPAQLSDPLISGENADPDADGIANLLEWACGLNPITSSSLPTPTVAVGDSLEFCYPRGLVSLDAGAVFTVEWSDTMAPTDWHVTGITEQILSDNGTVQQVKALVPVGSGGRRFVRLKVTGP